MHHVYWRNNWDISGSCAFFFHLSTPQLEWVIHFGTETGKQINKWNKHKGKRKKIHLGRELGGKSHCIWNWGKLWSKNWKNILLGTEQENWHFRKTQVCVGFMWMFSQRTHEFPSRSLVFAPFRNTFPWNLTWPCSSWKIQHVYALSLNLEPFQHCVGFSVDRFWLEFTVLAGVYSTFFLSFIIYFMHTFLDM